MMKHQDFPSCNLSRSIRKVLLGGNIKTMRFILTVALLCQLKYSTHQAHAFIPDHHVKENLILQSGVRTISSIQSLSQRKNIVKSSSLVFSTNGLNEKDEGKMNETNAPKRRKRDKLIASMTSAKAKFLARPGTYLLIPFIAAFVGWFTNYLAVQMIFYPIQYRGLNIIRWPEVPLGLLGWQGIVPCKTKKMSIAMVDMVTTQLLSVEEVFRKLNPQTIANLLAPEVPKLSESILSDILPPPILPLPKAAFMGLPTRTKEMISHWNRRFLIDFTKDMQNNIGQLLNIENCVVNQMLLDRSLLGKLFQRCGQVELDFLTNSGLWFGFLLGLIQMVVALFWENPWSLSIGGGIVGLATNWLALKWIFEPVNPTKIGPFILQGQFLRRQKAVAVEFSNFFANNVLTSEKLWHSILTDPVTSPNFNRIFTKHLSKFVLLVTGGLKIAPEQEVISMAAKRAVEKLPNHVGVLHSYVDKKLGLEETLRVQMEKMSSEQFERVLHPIFEEDELTLILAGAVLGFAAGLIQQGLETGKIKFPTRKAAVVWIKSAPSKLNNAKKRVIEFRPRRATLNGIQNVKSILSDKVFRRKRKNVSTENQLIKKVEIEDSN